MARKRGQRSGDMQAKHSTLAGKMVASLGKAFKPEGEIRPADMVPVIAPDASGRRKVFPMVWGFSIEGLSRPVINARVESARNKVTFKEAWQRRRCVVPASYYFEWGHYQLDGRILTGDRYAIRLGNDSGESVYNKRGIIFL